MSTEDPTNGAHAAFMAHCAALEHNPPKPLWYWESDGEPHAKTYYVRHTRKIDRIDCESLAEAKALAKRLNEESEPQAQARELYESLAREFVRLGAASNVLSKLEELYHLAEGKR